jgi:ethanolamine ammonia-lyase small subunit
VGVRHRTPARLLEGRTGAAYRTHTQIELRQAHASARDAVRAELNLERDFGTAFLERWKLFEVSTQATNKQEYLLRPDLGRCFSDPARAELSRRCLPSPDLQIVIGDGLSVTAVSKQVPALFIGCASRQRTQLENRTPFVIRHCRVGSSARWIAIRATSRRSLIGERPG